MSRGASILDKSQGLFPFLILFLCRTFSRLLPALPNSVDGLQFRRRLPSATARSRRATRFRYPTASSRHDCTPSTRAAQEQRSHSENMTQGCRSQRVQEFHPPFWRHSESSDADRSAMERCIRFVVAMSVHPIPPRLMLVHHNSGVPTFLTLLHRFLLSLSSTDL
ncbi:hypothetical protein QBC34DRAFT_67071 [Podospora aff. communis PSN243]|uniref:Secreted protein n=1 Tax=Podospora aff. communis PSN243 TaxID=3040156 RepID=A0AAV9H636_9PEZI|nr:hypothetical protein QBC34DRAFT_67071 [Podospora aff. communis PSN243]